jgi:riboflavin synthase
MVPGNRSRAAPELTTPREGSTFVFTGIVEERGTVIDLRRDNGIVQLTIHGALVTSDIRPGASVAVNGCCLTAVDVCRTAGTLTVDVVAETLRRTSLGDARPGFDVNLERALTANSRLAGHLVQGHIDGLGTVVERVRTPDEELLWIELPADLARYLAPKGSIAVDGVSLTVVDVRDQPEPAFSVALIPTTRRLTTLGDKQKSDAVNLEVDVIAKYVERHLARFGIDQLAVRAEPIPPTEVFIPQGSTA